MSSSYYVTYGTDRLTFGGSGSVAWAAPEPPPLTSRAWIASGSSYFSSSVNLETGMRVYVGGAAGFPFACTYFSSEVPASSVLTSTSLTSQSQIYTGDREISHSSEEVGSSFRVDVPFRNVYFKFINSSELGCSFSSRRNAHTATIYGGVTIPTAEASAAEYINATPASITTSNGKLRTSLPKPAAAVTYDYTGSALFSSEFTAASALFSTAAYYGKNDSVSPTRTWITGVTGCVHTTNSYTDFLSWTASGEI